jgi:hypothetical protein
MEWDHMEHSQYEIFAFSRTNRLRSSHSLTESSCMDREIQSVRDSRDCIVNGSHFTTTQSEDIGFVALEQGHGKTCRNWDDIEKLSRG